MKRSHLAIIAAAGAIALTAGSGFTATDTAQAGSCRPDYKQHTDNRGNHWPIGWICGNRAGAGVYLGPDYVRRVSTMLSNPSWFVCYIHGAFHTGQNDIWYYTKGDRMTPGNGAAGNWGYMPAVDVWTSIDPWPFMHSCV